MARGKTHKIGQLVKKIKYGIPTEKQEAFRELRANMKDRLSKAGMQHNIPTREILQQIWMQIQNSSRPNQRDATVSTAVAQIQRRQKTGRRAFGIKKGEMKQLVIRAAAGDSKAFNRIVKINMPQIVRESQRFNLPIETLIEQLRKNILNLNFKNTTIKSSIKLAIRRLNLEKRKRGK